MGSTAPKLLRELSFADVVIAGIGTIIGAGIFAVLGVAAARAGNAIWISFGIAGIAAAFTALSYAEFASMFPRAGAEFDYISEAFGRKPGFIIGCVVLFSCVIASAMVMTSCAGYAASIFGIHPVLIAYCLVPPFLFLLLRGVKDLARAVILSTFAEVGCLLCLLAVSVPFIGSQDYSAMPYGYAGVLSASATVFVAFAGFESIVKLAGETRQPERVIPRALLIALAAVTALYAVAAFGSVSVAGWEALANSQIPITFVFEKALHMNSAHIVSAVIALGIANTAVMILFAGSRVLYGMSAAGVLPAPLSELSPVWQVPSKAVLVTCLLVLPLLALGSVDFLACLTSFFLLSAYIIVNAGVIWLRIRDPRRPRPFRIPLSIRKVPVTACLGIIVSGPLLLLLPADVIVSGLICFVCIGIITLFAGRRGYLS